MAIKSNKKESETSGKKNWKEDEMGGLWKNEKSGFRGTLTIDGKTQRVIVLPNSFKQEGDKSPDFRVYKDNWVPDPNYAKNGAEREKKSGKVTPAPNSYVDEEEIEDIPF